MFETPFNVSATDDVPAYVDVAAYIAAGTAPKIFRGVISPSYEGVEPVPPMLTPKYKVWLKFTFVNGVVDPSMMLNKPLLTVTR